MADDRILLETRQVSPTRNGEGILGIQQGTPFSEAYVKVVDAYHYATRGNYFTATTVPTDAATGVAGHAAPVAYIDTKPYLTFKNTNTSSSGIRAHLDYVRLRYTAIGAGGTLPRYWTATDGEGVSRYSSGGTEITLKPNANTASTAASTCTIFHGAVVSPAASAAQRVIQTGQIRPVIPVIYDEVIFAFGQGAMRGAPSILSGTLVATQVIPHPPVVLGPNGTTFLLHLWRASQSGADSYEVDLGWWER